MLFAMSHTRSWLPLTMGFAICHGQVSCQLSRYLKGVILFKAAGWTGVQSDFCKPSKPLHVLLVQDRRLYPSNDSTAAAPTSESDVVFTDIFGVPPKHPQVQLSSVEFLPI